MDNILFLWVIVLMIITLLLAVILSATSAFSLLYGARTRLESRRRWLLSLSSSVPLLPLGTLGWPFIGETMEFISSAYTHSPESFSKKRFEEVFKSHLFGSPTIVSTDPEFSKIVRQSDAKNFVPSYPKSLTELMGKSSILVINGSLQKKIYGPIAVFFKSPHLRTHVTNNKQNYVQRSMETWTEHVPVLIQNEVKTVSFLVIISGKKLLCIAWSDRVDLDNQVAFKEFAIIAVDIGLEIPSLLHHEYFKSCPLFSDYNLPERNFRSQSQV